jgi:hypothetical protein
MPLRQSLLLRRDEVPIAPDLHRRHGNGPGQGLGCYPAEEHGSKPGPRVPGPATTQGSMDPTQPTRYPGPPQPLQQAMDSTRLPQKTPCAYWHMDPTSTGVHAPALVRPPSSPLRSRGVHEIWVRVGRRRQAWSHVEFGPTGAQHGWPHGGRSLPAVLLQ